MTVIRITAVGGPEVLETHDETATPRTALATPPDGPPGGVPGPGAGMVAVEIAAAGVNYIDTYQRSGLYPLPLPAVLGLEGAGTVTAVGAGVTDLDVGQRVAWCDVLGSYADRAVLPAGRVVPVPDAVPLETAAAVMLQGATAHYLAHDTIALTSGMTCLVHAGAGGVGLLLIQLAKRLGARVVTTVGSPQKSDLARAAGADDVVLYREEEFGAAVERLVGAHGVDVVYDGIGRATFARGLDVLRPRGLMVSFGNASGPVEALTPLLLSQKGSLYLTRPTLGHYTATTQELRTRCAQILGLVAGGELDVRIGLRLPLSQARQAHLALEGRQTTGKVLLIP